MLAAQAGERPVGQASAVLLRAGEVVAGIDGARARRTPPGGAVPPDRDLARGPARLAVALGLDGSANGADLLDPDAPVRLEAATTPPAPELVRAGPRVGISVGTDTPWRFWLAGEPSVSAFRGQPRPSKRAR